MQFLCSKPADSRTLAGSRITLRVCYKFHYPYRGERDAPGLLPGYFAGVYDKRGEVAATPLRVHFFP